MDLITVKGRPGGGAEIVVRGHRWTGDMSLSDGGGDIGPSPSEWLVASLGACIVMMVRSYCERHGWRDGHVAVSMTYEMAGDPVRIDGIVADLEIPRDVPEDRRPAVLRIAEVCPIHATLQRPPRIDLEIL